MNNTANTPLDLKVNNTSAEESNIPYAQPAPQSVPGIVAQGTPQNVPVPEANGEEAQNPSVYTHTLSKPLVFEEKEYTTLTFDFDRLKGDDGISVERELSALGVTLIQPEISTDYLVRMAARACTTAISFDIFSKMSLRDCIKIKNKTRNFLLLQA